MKVNVQDSGARHEDASIKDDGNAQENGEKDVKLTEN